METQHRIRHELRRRLAVFPRGLLLIALLVGSAGVSSTAHAATHYLNTLTGADSNLGTPAAPWKTLAKVQSSASAGDTIVLQAADAGTYAAPWPTGFSYRATALQQFTITWTFDTDYAVGQFATGDFWVVGPVKLVGIDPPSAVDSTGRVTNGSMLNPSVGCALPQGYDSAMPAISYDAKSNVAFGVSAGSPLLVTPPASLLSSISLPTAGAIPQMARIAVLTVLGTAPPEGSFRPAYCGARTVKFNKSALDYSLLQKLSPVSGTPTLADVTAQFAAPWIEHDGGWTATALRPAANMPNYGREMHTAIGTAALMLHLNFTDAQKEKLLIGFVQCGIDLYAVATNGGNGNWVGEGGQGGGRKWPILFAGLMLHDDALKSIGAKSGDYLYQNGYGPGNVPPDYIAFGEDDQTFYVAQSDVDVTHGPTWNPDSRDAVRTPYDVCDIGLPEWGITHSRWPYTSNKWWYTEYRTVAGPPFHGTALAALLMNGAKALWNHNAYFDYTDRYMTMTAANGPYPGWRSMSPFTANMWDTYRAQCGPTWPAVSSSSSGPTLAPISNQQITAGQTLTLILRGTGPDPAALTYSASGLPAGAAFSGQTFTWTPSAAQVGTYQVTFTLSDGKYQDSKTITITVTKGNSAPVLGAIGNKSVNENQTLVVHRKRHRCRWRHPDLYGEQPARRGDLHGPDVPLDAHLQPGRQL